MIGSVKVIEAAVDSEPMKVAIAILWPQKAPFWSCELGVAPVAKWHNRQLEILHQLMGQWVQASVLSGSRLAVHLFQRYPLV